MLSPGVPVVAGVPAAGAAFPILLLMSLLLNVISHAYNAHIVKNPSQQYAPIISDIKNNIQDMSPLLSFPIFIANENTKIEPITTLRGRWGVMF
jgi:hypothetical protein